MLQRFWRNLFTAWFRLPRWFPKARMRAIRDAIARKAANSEAPIPKALQVRSRLDVDVAIPLRERAGKQLREAFERLPRVARPTVVHLIDADLPRTATRKVKRSEVRQHLARIVEATTELGPSKGTGTAVRHALARLGRHLTAFGCGTRGTPRR